MLSPEHSCETELELPPWPYTYQKQTYGYQRGNTDRTDTSGAWDEHTHTTKYKTDNQQGPTV